ncbi:MAG: glucuronate isomerase [Sedimentisphaerales bacterium]|jgi:glucuronate isomerase|nr:glucuronate isomerase [Sedimentisphaerales bacterium]
MAKAFLDEDLLLENEPARLLYHRFAEQMPIYDYHCHLPARQIAQDTRFQTITEAWLAGDHYKWRAMRANGIDEQYCTGTASDQEKFRAWARTVPYCIGNPLYHWTHLELKRYFGIYGLVLNEQTADRIYAAANRLLAEPEYSVRGLLRKMNVRLVCTTDDPLDDLQYHRAIKASGFEIAVHPAWRPDRAMATEDIQALNKYIDRLGEITNRDISTFDRYIEAIRQRHQFFHDNGCRLSDHGIEWLYAEPYTDTEIQRIFVQIRKGKMLDQQQAVKFKSAMLYELALMDAEAGWVQQFHLGAMRNNNTRMFRLLGPDSGFDSIGDWELARSTARFLDRLDSQGRLTKTILYNLNPKDNEVMATMIGNFQDGSYPGKIQWGAAWWFLDQKDGIYEHLRTLARCGLLSRFVGMLTDSRSFLSYPRHEYFRRILCNLIGSYVEAGEVPQDYELLGRMIQDICFNNARNYFPMECP